MGQSGNQNGNEHLCVFEAASVLAPLSEDRLNTVEHGVPSVLKGWLGRRIVGACKEEGQRGWLT